MEVGGTKKNPCQKSVKENEYTGFRKATEQEEIQM